MSFLGRTTRGDFGWGKRTTFLAVAGLLLAAVHGIVALVQLFSRQVGLAVFEGSVVMLVLAAIFSGLPRAPQAAVPPADRGAYRSGPAVPAIEPPRASTSFMEVVLTLFVALHVLVAIAAVVIAIGALLLVGLVAFLCSKH
jgi:hypothetical protein